jgi:hypothetical protein
MALLVGLGVDVTPVDLGAHGQPALRMERGGMTRGRKCFWSTYRQPEAAIPFPWMEEKQKKSRSIITATYTCRVRLIQCPPLASFHPVQPNAT